MAARRPPTSGGWMACALRGRVDCSLRGRTLILVVDRRLRPGDARSLHRYLAALLEPTGAELVVCDVSRLTAPDVETLDVLGRLGLVTRRLERELRLEGVSPRLRELLALAGLEDALLPGRASGLQPGREPEQREEPFGVEERVHADDHPV